jgi:hypothetical protein
MIALFANFPEMMKVNWAVPAAGLTIILAVALAAIAAKHTRIAALLGALLLVAIGLAVILLYFRAAVVNHAPAVAHEMATMHQRIAHKHQEFARQTAEMNARLEHQIANMEIHALMDQADAPRILLTQQPPAPEPPAAPAATKEKPDADEAKSQTDQAADADASQSDGASDAAAEGPVAEDAADEVTEASETDSEPESPSDTSSDDEDAAVDDAAPAAVTRPAWVDASSKRIGNTWRNVLVTDEFATKEECDREADRLLLRATYDHIAVLNGTTDQRSLSRTTPEGDDWKATQLASMGVTIDLIRREIAKDEHLETVERSFGPMKKIYTLVEFTPAVDRELRARWDNYRRRERFAAVGAGAASVLGLLGMAWGLLRVDTLTRGYYTKRLFLGVPAAIIGVIIGLMAWFQAIF